MQQAKKLRHYIPQVYLRSFLDVKIGKLAVYNISSDEHALKPILQICSEHDFFFIAGIDEFLESKKNSELRDGRDINVSAEYLEQELSKYESTIGRILLKIISQKSLQQIDLAEFIFLIDWITWLYLAKPAIRDLLKNRHPDIPNVHLNGFMSWHEKILPIFRYRSWGMMITNQPLLTGDCPVGIRVLKPKSVIPTDLVTLANAPIFFPLSPNLILIGEPNPTHSILVMKTKHANAALIRQANLLIFMSSTQVIAQKRSDIQNFYNAF